MDQKEEQAVPVVEKSRTDDSDVPVYYESFGYAAENGEVDLYRISRQLNEECRNAIEEAIADNFDGMNLADDATKSVVEQFGMERMGYILAYTLNYNNHDGRYSHSNKEWADTTCKGERGSNIRTDWIVRSHPAVLNGFVDMYRKELAAEQQREPEKPFVQQFYVVTDLQTNPIQGVTPVQIRERMEKLNPDRFRVRKFGVSDVIVTSIGGKTQSYYVNPKELIKFNGFFTKLPNGEYLLLNEEGYQVEGQKGTWTVTDEKTIDEQRFVLMVNDQKPDLLPSIVVQSDGKFITSTASGFDNATVRKVRELLHHEKFLENGTAERARESGTEQNYNMIDGCVNNVPKKPRVIGGRVSVLDRLHIKQAERARKDNAQVQQQERTRKN